MKILSKIAYRALFLLDNKSYLLKRKRLSRKAIRNNKAKRKGTD